MHPIDMNHEINIIQDPQFTKPPCISHIVHGVLYAPQQGAQFAVKRIYYYESGHIIPQYSIIISHGQSTSTPLVLKSALAMSISFISSACASGTSLNVKTPKPSLNSR
jgi:hypothetical protein